MKVFAGKWQLFVTAKRQDGGDESILYEAETNCPDHHGVLVFYSVGGDDFVIQGEATRKYLQLENPLEIDWRRRTTCFTAFKLTAEFDAAFRFVIQDGSFDRRQGQEQWEWLCYALCLQRSADGSSVQLGFRALDYGYDDNPSSWNTPCKNNIREQFDPLGMTLPNSTAEAVRAADLTLKNWTPALSEIRRLGDGKALDLTGVDLSGQNLSNINLENADLRGADLTRAIVDGVTLSGAKMNGADLSYVDATRIKYDPARPPSIEGSEGKLTSFNGGTVPVRLLGKNWSYLNLDSSTISGLHDAHLNLTDIKAVGANLSNLDLSELVLDNADFTNATIINSSFRKSSLKNKPIFEGAKLYNTKFISSVVEDGCFQSAQLGGVHEYPAADFSYAYLSNINLSSANLYAVNMVGVTMFGGETTIGGKAILDSVNLSGAYLVEVNFKDLSMRGASLDNACLINAVFTGSDLTAFEGVKHTTLTNACLQGADFSNAKLDEANLTNAAISFDKGELPVQYRDETGKLSEQFPHRYKKTSGLEQVDALAPSMICPNGATVEENKRKNISLSQMLTASDPPTSWNPVVSKDYDGRLSDHAQPELG
jgi:uncharacterized protein YjbI with pentapeptide repeats